MSLLITRSGLLDTIQDGGRYGYQHLGINAGGVMDNVAMRVANLLTGNDPSEAVIEMYFPAAEIVFESTVLISLAGADFAATINGEKIPMLHPVMIREGSILRFTKQENGASICLAVQGGFVAEQWLNSYSTQLKVKAGGYNGRALQKNDRIQLKQKPEYDFSDGDHFFEILPWQAKTTDFYTDTVRFVNGNEYDVLNDASKDQLITELFTISRESDRMGYRMQGKALQLVESKEMISTAATRGTIQLLPNGQLIILMADHQTSGGYPRLGHVISADIPSLAQMRPGEKISLQQVSMADAENILLKQEMNLRQLQNACNFRLQEYLGT
jgi:antagonist of KipI